MKASIGQDVLAQEDAGDVPRMSLELNPQNLVDLFAADPECGKKQAKDPRAMHFAGAKLDDEFEMKKLQVFVRIRPPAKEGAPRWDAEHGDCIHASSKHSLAIAPPEASVAYRSGDRGQTFSFTRVFDAATPQDEYYSGTAAPLVADLLRNPQHNSVVMAYGITAAGKTYTIEGTKAAPGVLPRALRAMFEGLAAHAEATSLSVRASYCEIYNEALFDLLEEGPGAWPRERPALRLKEDARGKVIVAGLSEVQVNSAEDALALMRKGARQRQRGETGLNYSSSRSHSIFTVMLFYSRGGAASSGPAGEAEGGGAGEDSEGEEERLGRLSFVDLAGSERAQRTGNVGVRLKESVAINSSLMTLGRCLEALRWNQQQQLAARSGAASGPLRVVPYRESKVTHLFRDALHGYGRVVLSVSVSPSARDYDETAHVLRYASLATQIGTLQQAEAPRRTIKAVTPGAVRRAKRKAELAKAAEVGKKAKKGGHTPQPGSSKAEDAEAQVACSQELPAGAVAAAGGEDVVQGGEEDEDEEIVYELHRPQDPLDSPQHDAPPREPSPAAHVDFASHAAAQPAVAGPCPGSGGGDTLCGAEYGTPSTPCNSAEGDAVAALQAQVQQLIGDLQAAEERSVLLEGEVREEVAAEMAQLLKDMEESYKERLAAELAAASGGAAAAGKGKGRGGKAAGKSAAVRPGSADSSGSEGNNAAAAAAAELVNVRGELELHQQQARGQAERIAVLEETAAAALRELIAAQAEAEVQVTRCNVVQGELEAERQRAAALQAQLAEMRRRSEEVEATATAGFCDRLREEVTQVEANNAMELEMVEQQAERLRKDNTALRQQLQAAMSALAASSSPSAAPLMQRLATACPAGGGRGAGGTPHDVALARARMATAQEDALAAAGGSAAGGRSTGPRTGGSHRGMSRFAEEAPQPSTVGSQPEDPAPGLVREAGDAKPSADAQADCPADERAGGFAGAAADEQAALPIVTAVEADAVHVPGDAELKEAEAEPEAAPSRRGRRGTQAGPRPTSKASKAAAGEDSSAKEGPHTMRAWQALAAAASMEGLPAIPEDIEGGSPAAPATGVGATAVMSPEQHAPAEEHDVVPELALPAEQPSVHPVQPVPLKRGGGRRGHRPTAVVNLSVDASLAELAVQESAGGATTATNASAAAKPEQRRPALRQRRHTVVYRAVHVLGELHLVVREGAVIPAEPPAAARRPRNKAAAAPLMASIEEEGGAPGPAAAPLEASAAEAAQKDHRDTEARPAAPEEAKAAAVALAETNRAARRMSRATSRDISAAVAAACPEAGAEPSQEVVLAVAKRGRKRRLQPAKPLSAAMRSALGELAEGDMPMREQVPARKQQNGGLTAAAGLRGVAAARPRSPTVRSRRQTANYHI